MVSLVVPDDSPRVLSGTDTERRLRAFADVVIHTEPGADRPQELERRVAPAEVVLALRAYSRFTERVLAACPRLRMISVWGTGTDNVDLNACHARGIVVTSTAGANARSVAEHTMALMLGVTRRVAPLDAGLRAGTWAGGQLTQLEGRTLGVIGLGAVGVRVVELGTAFGMRVLTWTRRPDPARRRAVGGTLVSLETLLRESDIVTLHLRLSAETTNLLDADRLRLMKPGAVLINTARAALVDRDALLEALRRGPLAGAGLDVFHQEPLSSDDALLGLPNVLLTPHIAGATPEAIEAGLRMAVAAIERFLNVPASASALSRGPFEAGRPVG